MIPLPALHPHPTELDFVCPACQVGLNPRGWYMPGARQLADLVCPQCQREFYGDLPAGHGLFYPALLDKQTGMSVSGWHNWFERDLERIYAKRHDSALTITFETRRPIQKPALLNALDGIYGHSIEKILNCQYFIDHSDYDLIVLVPRYLAWLIPQGVAAVGVVDAPLRQLGEWHATLHTALAQYLAPFPSVALIPSLPEINPASYQMERFTGIPAFRLDDWHKRPLQVSFIWREDSRLWAWRDRLLSSRLKRVTQVHILKINALLEAQKDNVSALFEALQAQNVALKLLGIGRYGDFSALADDQRVERPDASTERQWLQTCAESQLVIGVHGSHLLLPSAHAGAVIDIMPEDRWGNIAQDIIHSPEQTPREAMARYHFMPIHSTPLQVAQRALKLLQHLPDMLVSFRADLNDFGRLKHWQVIRKQRREQKP